MTSPTTQPRRRLAPVIILAAMALTGCFEARLQWSPDGSHAAVRTRHGLLPQRQQGETVRYAAARRARLRLDERWETFGSSTDVGENQNLAIARLEGGKLTLGIPLYTGLGIADIQVSPSDRLIAFTASLEKGSEEVGLFLTPSDGSTAPVLVARQVAAYPDWTTDGRAIVYFQASGTGGADSDELRLGVLFEHELADAEGNVEIAPKPVYLAGVLFNQFARARCLRDGRVLFNAAVMQLPFATADAGGQREQLFAVDRTRQPTLSRMIPRKSEEALPPGLSYFTVSPGEDKVLFGTLKGDVHVLTLATGQVDQVQTATEDEMQGAPSWRADGTFTYVRRQRTARRPAEMVLRQAGQETVLSANWSNQMLEDLTQ